MKSLSIRNHQFIWGQRTYLMGILNVTPDSFSDGGKFDNISSALAQAKAMIQSGVDIIDIGGESTRPGAIPVSEQEELKRVIPVIQGIRQLSSSNVVISIDTTKSLVAQEAIVNGADIVNDVSGGLFDDLMLPTVAKLGVPFIIMHLRGNPTTMQQLTDYGDVVIDVINALKERIKAAESAGIERSNLIIDPGIGFAKNYQQNIELLQRLGEFKQLDLPLLLGVSRKSFIGQILNQPDPSKRVWGTSAACHFAIASGADILRVHDVNEMSEVVRVSDVLCRKLN